MSGRAERWVAAWAGSVVPGAGQAHQQPAPPQLALELPFRRWGAIRLPDPAEMAEQGKTPQHEGDAHQKLEAEVEHLPLKTRSTLGVDSRAGVRSCWSQRADARLGTR